MTNPNTIDEAEPMQDLITRLREAEEGSWELDAEIHCALNPKWEVPELMQVMCITNEDGDTREQLVCDDPWVCMLHYTTSIDDALKLVEGGLMVRMSINYLPGPALVYLERHIGGGVQQVANGHSKTLPLALCIAALTALHQQQRD